jgi:hypothetical protein
MREKSEKKAELLGAVQLVDNIRKRFDEENLSTPEPIGVVLCGVGHNNPIRDLSQDLPLVAIHIPQSEAIGFKKVLKPPDDFIQEILLRQQLDFFEKEYQEIKKDYYCDIRQQVLPKYLEAERRLNELFTKVKLEKERLEEAKAVEVLVVAYKKLFFDIQEDLSVPHVGPSSQQKIFYFPS